MSATDNTPSLRALIAAAKEAGSYDPDQVAWAARRTPTLYLSLIALARRIDKDLEKEPEYALRVAREVLALRFETTLCTEMADAYRSAKRDHYLTTIVEYLRPLLRDEEDVA